MNKALPEHGKWDERSSVETVPVPQHGSMFEAALKESRQLLASVLDNISEAVYRTNPNHELIFANQAYLRLSGYESLEEMQRIPREQLYARPEDRALLLQSLKRDGCFRNLEIEYIRRDGYRWWGLCNGVAVLDSGSGAVLYHVGSVADITERKRAQEKILSLNASLERRITERTAELSASEARWRTLVDHAPEAIVVVDADTGRFLSGNAHACRLFGRPKEGFTELNPELVSPESQPNGRCSAELAREKIREAMTGATPVFEWVHRRADGRLIPTEVRLVRLPAEGRNLVRASITDDTERKRREQVQQTTYQISEAVHTAEDLDSLFRKMHAIVKALMPADNFYIALADDRGEQVTFPYLVDERDRSTTPLPLGAGLTGYVIQSGKTLLAGPHNAVSREAGVAAIIEGGRRIEAADLGRGAAAAVWLGAPLTIRGRTFGAVAIQDYYNPSAYGEPEKQLLTFVAEQIALAIERKRADQAVRESEEKFRALFAASSQGVLLHDEFQYLEANPAAARILGYDRPEDLIGRHPKNTSPPFQPGGERSDDLAERHIAECMSRGSARFEWVCRRASGEDIPLEVILTRIEWGGRRIIQAGINDISERKKAEAELLKALAREKELGQLKSNFVSMVSHEFRTPLGIILSSAEILESYLDQLEPAQRAEQLQSIQGNAKRMATLMEEVLLLGTVEAGKMDFRPELTDLAAFCRQIIHEVSSASDGKCQIHFSTGRLPNEALADKRLFRHIFTNLLSNAVKYSTAGKSIHFTIQQEGGEAVCEIRDQGIGIPIEDQRWLFDAFQRGRNVGQISGTGLGLTIVKRCVELHLGRIKIESAVGKGTTVMVRLPIFSRA